MRCLKSIFTGPNPHFQLSGRFAATFLMLLALASNRAFAYHGPFAQNTGGCTIEIRLTTPCLNTGNAYYTLAPGQILDIGQEDSNACGQPTIGQVSIYDMNGNTLGSIYSVVDANNNSAQMISFDGCEANPPPVNDKIDLPPNTNTIPCGMPIWSVSEPYISLWLEDEPLGYQPSRGPRVSMQMMYKQREYTAGESPNIFSVGKKWNCSWLSYVFLDANTNPVVLLPSGGQITYYGHMDYSTMTSLIGDTTNGFTLSFPDGSTNVYHFMVTNSAGTFQQAFMTEQRDPQAQSLIFQYASYAPTNPVIRLLFVVDVDGGTNTLSYTASTTFGTNLITQVVDAFGRSISLQYDWLGRLTNLTDVVRLSTAFSYDGSDRVQGMTTPYGPTSFSYTETNSTQVAPNGRSVLVTEPDGNNLLFLYEDSALGVASSYATNYIPTTQGFSNSFDNSQLNLRNSFFWGKPQYLTLFTNNLTYFTSADFLKARMQHWLASGTSTVGGTLSIRREPSPTSNGSVAGQMTWFDYVGKTNAQYQGTQSAPLFVGLVLPDGASRFTRTDRNTNGFPVDVIDTYASGNSIKTRTNLFAYAANGVSLRAKPARELRVRIGHF